ncbi:hypothetical protein AVEN_231520-1 [Araneus ventricosus]|uniref:Immunoglobulin V-set domain-containing protein n=1 Tax=Araneus ventricosus TaxID=182803 RepID=A0A4Y2IB95_ARAVE|nr:hypothetical protein AVEN_231520-1 [Araneus ventricosus]
MKVPIYTLDARKGPIEKSKHFPSKQLGRRVHFDLHVRNPGLTIDPVKGEDQGIYRCRVEYKRYRTLSYMYELKVIGEYMGCRGSYSVIEFLLQGSFNCHVKSIALLIF